VDDAKLVDEELTRHFTAALTIQNDRDQQLDGLFGGEVSGRVVDCDFLLLPYTASELKAALLKKNKNKSPGDDGLPYEFYSIFWDLIGPHLTDVMTEVLKTGQLCPSQGRALIRLIPKIAVPLKASDFRPISLVNTN